MSVLAVQFAGLRLGGVLVVPITAIYGLYDFESLPILVGSTVVAYVALSVLRRRTFLFGRMLLLSSMVAGAVIPLGILLCADMALVSVDLTSEVIFLGSIMPGVAAYNFHRLESDKRVWDALFSLAAIASLFVCGLALVNPTTSELLADVGVPVLFNKGSDVARLRSAGAVEPQQSFAPGQLFATASIVLGLVLNEAVYDRWGVRLLGMISAPLMAMFVTIAPSSLAVYVTGLVLVTVAVEIVARRTLLYGRVLLSTGIALGVLTTTVAGTVVVLPGFTGLFVGVLVGVGGYNLHRVPAHERHLSVVLTGAVFGGFLLVAIALGHTPPGWRPATTALLAGGLLAVGVAVARELDDRHEPVRERAGGVGS
ncbi:poly-gamma-glutamate biosynthesis protein PgsC/CapC [Haloarchaeobius baliensis]|uniref:poly-gamma-glutamate biosynthesis protein PgsC/CapC n=1 Tax=Haloarchaeobius baliensis TaxID=1670458 RepID=UPI003F880E1E